MDIRISHTKTSRETIPATGFLGALGAPGTPAGEERIEVEVLDTENADLIDFAANALVNILDRNLIDAEIVDEDEDVDNGKSPTEPF